MRVNLGCGDRYADGWHNVDHQGCPHRKDETVDVCGPLPWTGITHAYAGHLLEHLYVGQVLSLLRRLRVCMAPDGELMIVGPDVLIAQGMAVAGTLDVTLESLTQGARRWTGDEHRWHCTTYDVEELCRSAGWTQVRRVGIQNVPDMWPVADRGPRWQCAVSARP